ncbi:hypothetical protein TcG_10011 [Trypanosoma cruzi]|nr:hypothetical protein TcG_10011 [Trypanosoma cruzi]
MLCLIACSAGQRSRRGFVSSHGAVAGQFVIAVALGAACRAANFGRWRSHRCVVGGKAVFGTRSPALQSKKPLHPCMDASAADMAGDCKAIPVQTRSFSGNLRGRSRPSFSAYGGTSAGS